MSVRVVLIEPRYARARDVVLKQRLSLYLPLLGIERPKFGCQFRNGDTLVVGGSGGSFRISPARERYEGVGVIVKLNGERVGEPAWTASAINRVLSVEMPNV